MGSSISLSGGSSEEKKTDTGDTPKGPENVVDAAVNQAASAVKAEDNLHGTLAVTVKRAFELDNIALTGDMNVQVKLTILGQTFRTPVAKGAGTNAAFDYKFDLHLDGVAGTIFAEVIHVDGMQSNTVGFGEVNLLELLQSTGQRIFTITRDGETSVGRFELGAEFTPEKV